MSSENIQVVDLDRGWTQMPNDALYQDPPLTLQARGALWTLVAQHPNRPRTVAELTARCANGKDMVANALRELEHYGYLRRTRYQVAGRWETVTQVCARPLLGDPTTSPPTLPPGARNVGPAANAYKPDGRVSPGRTGSGFPDSGSPASGSPATALGATDTGASTRSRATPVVPTGQQSLDVEHRSPAGDESDEAGTPGPVSKAHQPEQEQSQSGQDQGRAPEPAEVLPALLERTWTNPRQVPLPVVEHVHRRWQEITGRTRSQWHPHGDRAKQIRRALSGPDAVTAHRLDELMRGMALSDYHVRGGYLDPKHAARAANHERFEKLARMAEAPGDLTSTTPGSTITPSDSEIDRTFHNARRLAAANAQLAAAALSPPPPPPDWMLSRGAAALRATGTSGPAGLPAPGAAQ